MTSASEVSAVYKNTDQLTSDDYIEDMMLRFGASKKAVGRMMRTPDQLEEATATLQPNPSRNPCYTTETLLAGDTKVFLGNRLIETEPELYENFFYFEGNSWKLTHKIPRPWSSDIYAAKKTAQDAMDAYFPPSSTAKARCSMAYTDIGSRHESAGHWIDRHCGTSHDDLLGVGHSHHPVLVPKYVLTLFLRQGQCAVRDSASPNELASNLEKCPRLNAVLNETLRITTSSSTIRNVLNTITVGGKRLRKGTKVLVPHRQLHFDDRAFGKNPEVFDSDLFFDRKELSRSSNFRSFGGGTTYCPGRFVVKREVLTFVALALVRFDIKVAELAKARFHLFLR
ncbi:MAG: hypothetical protein Q9192_002729 [Flavoplaca navasiana]